MSKTSQIYHYRPTFLFIFTCTFFISWDICLGIWLIYLKKYSVAIFLIFSNSKSKVGMFLSRSFKVVSSPWHNSKMFFMTCILKWIFILGFLIFVDIYRGKKYCIFLIEKWVSVFCGVFEKKPMGIFLIFDKVEKNPWVFFFDI